MNHGVFDVASTGVRVQLLRCLPLILVCSTSTGCFDGPRVEQPAPFVRSVGPFSVASFSPTVVGNVRICIELDAWDAEVENTKDVTFVYHPVGAPQHSRRGNASPVNDRGFYEMALDFTEPGEWVIRFEARWIGGRTYSEGEIYMRVAPKQ